MAEEQEEVAGVKDNELLPSLSSSGASVPPSTKKKASLYRVTASNFGREGERKVSYHPLVERNYFSPSASIFGLKRGRGRGHGIQGAGKVPNCSSPPLHRLPLSLDQKKGERLLNPLFLVLVLFLPRRSGNFSPRSISSPPLRRPPAHHTKDGCEGRAPPPPLAPPLFSFSFLRSHPRKGDGEEHLAQFVQKKPWKFLALLASAIAMEGGRPWLRLDRLSVMADHKDHSVISLRRPPAEKREEIKVFFSCQCPEMLRRRRRLFSLDSIAFCAGAASAAAAVEL